jgi:eukaryotic-like serine/threonine-protein kinase
MATADRDLLFGLIALQNGLIEQDQLLNAFRAWSHDRGRTLAEHLVARGDFDAEARTGVEAMVSLHLKKHGGDVEQSLAAMPAGLSTRDSLLRLGNADIEASLVRARPARNEPVDEADRTASYGVGTATSDGLRYRVLRPHAKGGLGAVFVALDSELHREVALKQILEQHADDSMSRQRFVLEAEVTGGLEHPGIVPVYGLGTYADGRPYYAMRFIRGDSLKEAIERFHGNMALKNDPGRRSLEVRNLLRRFVDVCNAIEYAHSRGVLHRDIKPGNVIVGKHGETLVVDWGLAKTTGRADPEMGERTLMPSSSSGSTDTLPGSALGTPAYMSPEQARGDLEHLGPRSDVYSLGATLYCLLTGKPPLENKDAGAMLRAAQMGDFPPPRKLDATIDGPLEAVCLKAMALKPEDRYATPRSLADDIERWMADEPVTAWREPLGRRMRRWGRRHRTLVAAAAVALVVTALALLSGTLLIGRQRTAAIKQRDLARGNLEQARKIVDDMYTKVSESLTDQAGMDAYQREILEKAMQFYEGVALPQSDAPELRYEAGRSSFRVAEIRFKFNQPDAAEPAYLRAISLFSPLAGDYPDRPDYSQAHAGTLNSLALLYTSTGRLEQAEATFAQAAAIRRTLISAHPRDPAYRAGLARIENSLAVNYKQMNRRDDAEAAFNRAAALDREILKDHPDDRLIRAHLAKVLINLGASFNPETRRLEIESAYTEALAILRKLIKEQPQTVEFRSELAAGLMSLGALYAATGRPDQAEAANEQAVTMRQRLVEDHPDRAEFALDLGLSYYSMAYMKSWKKDHRATYEWASRAIQVFDASLRDQPRRSDIEELLGFGYHVRAQALTDERRGREALADWDRAIELAGEGNVRIPSLVASRALTFAYLGDLGRAINEVSAISRTGTDAGLIFYNEACIFAVAAGSVAKEAARDPAEHAALAEKYATRAIASLAESRRVGYFRDSSKIANMRSDQDLDALRTRADFQLLVRDLCFPAQPFAHPR